MDPSDGPDDGYLCESVNEFQRVKIKTLDSNAVMYPDMAWEIDGELLYDTRSVYTSSPFFSILFETSMNRDIRKLENGVVVFSLDCKPQIFDVIRVFCHTGLVRFIRGETVLKTIERYSAFHYYGIDGGKFAIRKLISDKLTPSNATQAFEFAVGRDDTDLLKDITEYITNYAFLVFKHRNFLNLKRESMGYLSILCSENSLNITELDLLECLFKLCKKKITEKEYCDFENPIDIFKFKFGDNSLWDTIRLNSISMDKFMDFVKMYDTFMSNDDIVETLKIIHSPMDNNGNKKRKRFQLVSSYPRNLNIDGSHGPQGDITHWEKDKVQVFFTFDFSKKDTIHMPSIVFRDWTIRCSVHNIDKHLCLKGSIVIGSLYNQEEYDENIVITTKFVNFVHERWKKSVVTGGLKTLREFEIPNMISCHSIDGSTASGGYLFDINKYPDYIDNGESSSWLMMCLSIEIPKK